MISDAVLALVCYACAAWLWRGGEARHKYGAVGLLIIAIAATVGSARFGGAPLEVPHELLSKAAAVVGVPLVGLSFLVWRSKALQVAVVWLVVAGLLLGPIEAYRLGIGAFAMAMVLVARQPVGAVGAVLTAIAGLAIGTDGEIAGIARLDLFHYTLAVANVCLAVGLKQLPGDRLR